MTVFRAGLKCCYAPGKQQGGSPLCRLVCRCSQSCSWNPHPLLGFTLSPGLLCVEGGYRTDLQKL